MELFIELILSILFFILFLKIWAMTNDIDKISKNVKELSHKKEDNISLASYAFSMGNKEAVKIFLDNGVYNDIKNELNKTISISYKNKALDICYKYRKYYDLFQIEPQPDWNRILDKNTASPAINSLIPSNKDISTI